MTTKNTKKTAQTSNPIAESLIGKQVIVRANVAGVHFGTVKAVDFAVSTIQLENAYRLWRVYTRDSTGSISDIAANGLKAPLDKHSIGARLDEVVIVNPEGLEIAVCADCVLETIEQASPSYSK